MTLLDDPLDTDSWWDTIYVENTLAAPLRDVIEGFAEIADQAVPYNWLPGRARTFYGAHFTIWADFADESITTLIDRPKGGVGTVKAIVIAAREAVALARATPAGVVDEDAATSIRRLLARLSDYDYTVLSARGWALNPQTIPVTARQLGVAPVNITRNQPRAYRRLTDLLSDPAHTVITTASTTLRQRLGPLTCEQVARQALAEMDLDLDADSGQLVLHLAGPYARKDTWLEDTNLNGLAAATLAVEAALAERGAPTDPLLTSKLLELGIPADTAAAFIASFPGLRRFGDKRVRWGSSTVEKTEAALHVSGAPASAALIAATIGEDCHERSVRDALYNDQRFIRTTKQTWALRQWGRPEYTGLFSEIALCLDAGPVSTKTIVEELTRKFPDVAETSIRSYLSAPGFIIEDGMVRRRTPDDGWPTVAPLNTVRGVFRNGNKEIRVAVPVTAELLRGSGQTFHPALATALGIHPEQQRPFTGPPVDLTLFWRESALNGASVGSLRGLAGTLNANLGDTIVLIFHTGDSTVGATVLRTDDDLRARLKVLLGKAVRNPTSALARALKCDPGQLSALLERRGEKDLLAPLDEPGR